MTRRQQANRNRLLLRRWMNGAGEDRLWDRDGRLWRFSRSELSLDEASTLYFNQAVPVAIYDGAATLRWVEPNERRKAWDEIRRRAFDESWTPPRSAPGMLPFEAQEWRSDDDSLLLFDDHD